MIKSNLYVARFVTATLLLQAPFAGAAPMNCPQMFGSEQHGITGAGPDLAHLATPKERAAEHALDLAQEARDTGAVIEILEKPTTDERAEQLIEQIAGVEESDLNHASEPGDELVPKPRNRIIERIREMKDAFKGRVQAIRDVARSIIVMRQDIRNEMNREAMDEYMYSFYGFHNTNDRYYVSRTWKKLGSNLKAVEPSQVVRLSVEDFVSTAQVAMEVEDPTMEYSYASGETFSNVMPLVGRYMGKDAPQKMFDIETGKKQYCESSWCAEEERHGPLFKNVIIQLTGAPPKAIKPNETDEYGRDEENALLHLGTRQTYEWNAASGYFFLRASSVGPLHELMGEVMRDEVKHLTLMSAAYTWMFGDRPWTRFGILVKNSLEILKYQQANRNGAEVSTKASTMLKVALAHLFAEVQVRRYLRTVPKMMLARFFDGTTQKPELSSVEVTPEMKAEVEAIRKKYRDERMNFTRWPKAQADAMRARLAFENAHRDGLDRIVHTELHDFEGMEMLDRAQQKALEQRIRRIAASVANSGIFKPNDLRQEAMINAILYDRLREFQIVNNRHELERRAEARAKAAKKV